GGGQGGQARRRERGSGRSGRREPRRSRAADRGTARRARGRGQGGGRGGAGSRGRSLARSAPRGRGGRIERLSRNRRTNQEGPDLRGSGPSWFSGSGGSVGERGVLFVFAAEF